MSSFKFAHVAAAFQLSAVLAHGFVDEITIDSQVLPGTNLSRLRNLSSGGNGPSIDVNNAQVTCGRITGSAQISATVAKVEVSWNGAGFPWPAGDTGLARLIITGPCDGKCSEQPTESLNFVKIQERTCLAAGPPPHPRDPTPRDPRPPRRFYPICANLIITGDGSSPPPAGVPIAGPGYATSPLLKVNLFDGSLEGQNYVAPDPPVFDAAPARREAWAWPDVTINVSPQWRIPLHLLSPQMSEHELSAKWTLRHTDLDPRASAFSALTKISGTLNDAAVTVATGILGLMPNLMGSSDGEVQFQACT
ncbi:hypothetical protein DFH09DRAFT_1096690 [Mycena vulgaris]|nr:hypothetical protein DFH09DRAFT_1096690 [Mycena vulgaris]